MTTIDRLSTARTRPAAALAIAICLAMAGCQGQASAPENAAEIQPPTLESPESVAACLPAGVTLETKTTDKDGDTSETVKDALARLKATTKNRKLYDLNGREIAFHKPTATGLALVKDRELNKLRRKHTVVLLAP